MQQRPRQSQQEQQAEDKAVYRVVDRGDVWQLAKHYLHHRVHLVH